MDVISSEKIGILSGVGPLAGAYVLEAAIQYAASHYGAVEDSEYPDILLVSHGVAGVGNQADLSDGFEAEMIAGVKKLEQMGATKVGIACNTAHVYWDSIVSATNAEVVNIIEQTAFAAAKTDKKYLLLTSRSSREQKIHEPYFEKFGVKYAYVNEAFQIKLDTIIGLVMACKLKQAGQLMNDVLAEAKEIGFNAVVAGCTELPVALSHVNGQRDLQILDSSYILAKALVDRSYE